MVEEQGHAARHDFLHFIGTTKGVELLAPTVNLRGEVDTYGTDVVARAAEGACGDVVAVCLGIAQHAEVDTYRTWNEVGVAVAG